jgi:hypothetical protein
MAVHVPVVVKHIAIAKMFWRTCMKWHYSPDLPAESRFLSNGYCPILDSAKAETASSFEKEMNQSHSGTHLGPCSWAIGQTE